MLVHGPDYTVLSLGFKEILLLSISFSIYLMKLCGFVDVVVDRKSSRVVIIKSIKWQSLRDRGIGMIWLTEA